ncbi:MAG: hypothetical protein Q9166_003615, partial [cf. Caloplaca sp. 2 TL-2023]
SLPQANDTNPPAKAAGNSKRRFDVLGLMAFAITMASFLMLLDLGSKEVHFANPKTIVLVVACAISAIMFVLIEAYWATNPMISLSLLRHKGQGSYFAIQVLLLIAQFTMVSNLASYFARTEDATNSVAALHITPAPVGNAIGSLLGGKLISRTKRYKSLSLFAAALCTVSFIAIMLRWHGRLNVWESLYILPASIGVGLLNATQFVAVSAAVEKKHLATSISIFLLSQQVGMMIGAGGSTALLRREFRDKLVERLGGRMDGAQIIKDVLDDNHAARRLSRALQSVVLSSYVHGFFCITILSICASSLTLPFLVFLPEKNIG